MSSPAVPDIESQESETLMPLEEEAEKGWWDDRNIQTRITQGIAIACGVLHIVAVAWESAAATVVLAAIFGIGLSVAVFYFQLQIQDNDSLRTVQNQLRHQVNRLFNQNKELKNNNDRLEVQVAKLKGEEEKLSVIAEAQGSNVQSLVDLVKENQTTLSGLKKCLKADTEQMFLKAVLDSDWDQSNEFSDQEIQMLEYRLKNINGVTVSNSILATKIKQTDRTLPSVLNLLSELDNDAMPDEERIFIIHEDSVLKT